MDLEKRDALVAYLADGKYPENYSENEKRVLRRFSKWFVLKGDRILYHLRDAGKVAKPQEQRIAEAQLVIVGDAEKRNIIERTHKGIGGGHFGMNKTSDTIFTEEIRGPMPQIPSLADAFGMNAKFLNWTQWLLLDVFAQELGLRQLSQINMAEYGAVATLWLFLVRLHNIVHFKNALRQAKVLFTCSKVPGPQDVDEKKSTDSSVQLDQLPSSGTHRSTTAHCICIRLLTRGDQAAHPFIRTAITTAVTLINEMINCEHLKVHITTHKKLLDEKTRQHWLKMGATEVREMLIPETYTTPRGSLFRARNMCYWQFVDGGVGSECDETRSWILTMDEEVVITRSMLRSFIIDVLNSPDVNDVGYAQPMPLIDITVGRVPFINKIVEATWVANHYCMLLRNRASNAISNCGFHGGCYFSKASVDRAIGNDWGPAPSLCDDFCVGIEAYKQKVHFKFLNGWFYEGTAASFKSLLTQRARIIRGVTYATYTLPMSRSLREMLVQGNIKAAILPICLSIMSILAMALLIQFKPIGPRCVVLDILTIFSSTVPALEYIVASTYMDMTKRDTAVFMLASPLIVHCGVISIVYTAVQFLVYKSIFEEWKRGSISWEVTPKQLAPEDNVRDSELKKTI